MKGQLKTLGGDHHQRLAVSTLADAGSVFVMKTNLDPMMAFSTSRTARPPQYICTPIHTQLVMTRFNTGQNAPRKPHALREATVKPT
ncbi:MAG: hypothetical protein LQ345_001418 [Seirophora villosa]|nr:MAG: hypothetical protein LQ345_001418 [Seirophora villosa]